MGQKFWGVSLKKIVPQDMEYFLEEKAAEGMILEPVGETGLFYFTFTEGKSTKSKFVIDSTALDKEMYKETLQKKGWELLGTTANFYIWRQDYDDKRPEDFTDMICRKKHMLVIGLIFLIVGLLCLALAIGSIYGIYLENQVGLRTHFWLYLIQSILQIPFVAYFLWASARLFKFRKDLV